MVKKLPQVSAAPPDGFTAALLSCGVLPTTLSAAEKSALDKDGYVVLAEVVAPDRLVRMRAAFESAARARQGSGGKSESGTRHFSDSSDPNFDCTVTHPRVLAAVHHVLQGPFRVFQVGGRDPLPGFGRQGLHTDWLARPPRAPLRTGDRALAPGRFHAAKRRQALDSGKPLAAAAAQVDAAAPEPAPRREAGRCWSRLRARLQRPHRPQRHAQRITGTAAPNPVSVRGSRCGAPRLGTSSPPRAPRRVCPRAPGRLRITC